MLQISQSEAVAKSLGLDPAGLPGSESPPPFASHWLCDLGELTKTLWASAFLSIKWGL